MAYDQILAQRIRIALQDIPGLQEKKMFGGVGFIIRGNLACGVNGDNLIVRVGTEKHQSALNQPHTRVFDMTGKPMSGWVVVEPTGLIRDVDLRQWITQGVEFSQTLPSK